MTPTEFAQLQECPLSLPKVLQALWYDKQGDWDTAHEIVQNAGERDSAWVHGYLHRQEGDISNARYWYNRCGKLEFKGTLNQEWDYIASSLLAQL